jgi:hypothetical protein
MSSLTGPALQLAGGLKKIIEKLVLLGFFFVTYSFSSSSNSLLIRFNAILRDEIKLGYAAEKDQNLKYCFERMI